MTARELYEYALVELNKIEAPSLLLEDYNYFINKAVQQYINLSYAKFEADQQSTDDLRVLKTTTLLTPNKIREMENYKDATNLINVINGGFWKSTYFVDLPEDYIHLLSCVVEYTVQGNNFKCYTNGEKVYFAARRLTTDMYSQILNNAYLRPMYKRPYYYLNNINTETTKPTFNPATGLSPTYTEMDKDIMEYNGGSFTLGTGDNVVSKPTENKGNYTNKYANSNLVDSQNTAGDRLANPSIVRLELRFGTDDTVFKPTMLYIDYLKAPMYIRLTQEQINATLDYSQVLEFPDYVCFEIVNIFTRLLMENASDPRLQTNMPINNTIVNPAMQAQAQSK